MFFDSTENIILYNDKMFRNIFYKDYYLGSESGKIGTFSLGFDKRSQ